MITAKTISQSIAAGLRTIKVLCFGKYDSRSASQVAPVGVDSAPIKDMVAVYSKTENDAERVIVGYFNASLLAAPGEIRIYATGADGSEKTRVWCRDNGKINIGGVGASDNTMHLVRFEDLEDALRTFKEDINSQIIGQFNSHTHPFVGVAVGAPGVTLAPTPTISPVTLDINNSKTNDLLIQ